MSRWWLVLGALVMSVTGRGEDKMVVAVQAFLAPEQEAALVKVWREALTIPDVKCALTDNARPHVTFGSWKVTAAELAEATAKFKALDGKLPAAEFVPKRSTKKAGYYLVPVDEADLARYHAGIHERLAFPYEKFRPMDVPGQWWPHLTMFHAPADTQPAVDQLWARLALPAKLKIASFGLVTFGPSTVVAEVRCR